MKESSSIEPFKKIAVRMYSRNGLFITCFKERKLGYNFGVSAGVLRTENIVAGGRLVFEKMADEWARVVWLEETNTRT